MVAPSATSTCEIRSPLTKVPVAEFRSKTWRLPSALLTSSAWRGEMIRAGRERITITAEQVKRALESSSDGAVEEGSVGAGRGTVAFGWKGGIGTSSRTLPASLGGHTLGVLVQTNFGGVLQMGGAPVGKELGQYAYKNETSTERGDGSCMIVVATDAPLSDRNLKRLAARAMMGMGRTGSSGSNGSGDFVIAFSTAKDARRAWDAKRTSTTELSNEESSALFEAVIEATEEAIYNSMLQATAVSAGGRAVEPLPVEKVREILAKYRPR